MIRTNRLHSYVKSTSSRETETGELAAGLGGSARKTIEDVGRTVQKQIARHPGVALAIGFSLGVALGCLTKRR